MEKTLLDFVTEKTRALIAAPTCCSQLKAMAEDWLNAAGTAQEAEATRRYVAEMEADIMPAEGLLAFAKSEMGAKVFGPENAPNVAAHAQAAGGRGGTLLRLCRLYHLRRHPGKEGAAAGVKQNP